MTTAEGNLRLLTKFCLLLLCPSLIFAANGAQWTQLSPTNPPGARSQNGAVFDPSSGDMILFNDGCGATCDHNDVWTLSFGSSTPQWTQVNPSTNDGDTPLITPRTGASVVYDVSPNSNEVVLGVFGGGTGASSPCQNDTWTLNDVFGSPFWQQLDTGGTPPAARIFHTAVYDPNSNSMIVFGGNNCLTQGAVFYNDVWVLSNSNGFDDSTPTWTQLTPTGTAPAARENHTAIYDPTTNYMVIFGGANSQGVLNDVWLLENANGASDTPPQWLQITPNGTPPPARAGAVAVYDPNTNRMYLFGGNNGTTFFNDVWVLTNANGTGGVPTWLQIAPNGTLPAARSELAAAYNPSTQQLAIFGGSASGASFDDTWVLSLVAGPAASTTASIGTPQSTVVGATFDENLYVTVTDSTNNPVAGVTVNFSAPSTGASATLSSSTATTNDAGVASVSATANTVAGSYSVTASVPGVTPAATFALTNLAGPAALIVATGGTPQSAPIGTSFPVPLQATVTDQYGNPVSGYTVPFTAPTTGASAVLSASSAVTNTAGQAVVHATANNTPGSYQVLALLCNTNGCTPSEGTTTTFSLTNTKTAVLITLTSTATRNTFGGDVTFTASLSSKTATGKVTFYDGTAPIGYTSVSNGVASLSTILLSSGTHSITAYYSGDANNTAATSSALSQTVSPVPATTFRTLTAVPAGSNVQSVALGDFNGDGIPDLAVANYQANTVTILIGKGDGTFAPGVTYSAGAPYDIVVADFNGDGFEDLAIVSPSNSAVEILPGKGDGTFGAEISSPAQKASALAVGDFNRDGKPDIAVVNSTGNQVGILLGNGDGTFASGAVYGAGVTPNGVAVGDLNGDGIADLIVTTGGTGTAGAVNVFIGKGDGTFTAGTNYQISAVDGFPVVGDFNGDGKLDIAFSESANGDIGVMLGNGNGTFSAVSTYPAGTAPTQLAVGDFNGDSKPDLAVTDADNTVVNVFLNNGDGTFAAATQYAAGTNPARVVIADFNGDGKADLAVGDNSADSLTVLLAAGPSTSVAPTAGASQSALIDTAFGTLLQATVTDSGGNLMANVGVMFTAPSSGASGTFAGGGTTATVQTNASGVATAPAFTANAIAGSYTVDATVAGVATGAAFALTNTLPSTPSITTSSLPSGVVGNAYSAALTAQSGVAPYTWSIASGSLPAGLVLGTMSGVISGAPTSASNSTFTVLVTDSAGQTGTRALSITVNPVVSISLPSGNQQPGVSITNGQVQSGQAVPAALSGTVSLSFNENAANLPTPYVNPGVCFSTATCTGSPQTSVSFTIPAGSSSAAIPPFQTGNVAGDIVLTLTVPGQPATMSRVTVPRVAPVIEANSVQILDLTSTGFVVELVANSTPRDVQSATFTFTPAQGAQLNNTTFTVNLSSLLAQWYSSTQGQSYGSGFSLQVPFTLSGNASAIASVSVTLTNSVGTSNTVTGTP